MFEEFDWKDALAIAAGTAAAAGIGFGAYYGYKKYQEHKAAEEAAKIDDAELEALSQQIADMVKKTMSDQLKAKAEEKKEAPQMTEAEQKIIDDLQKEMSKMVDEYTSAIETVGGLSKSVAEEENK